MMDEIVVLDGVQMLRSGVPADRQGDAIPVDEWFAANRSPRRATVAPVEPVRVAKHKALRPS